MVQVSCIRFNRIDIINTATQNVNNAEQGLNGNTNLANAKQEATNALQINNDVRCTID
jgi:hypothetical protein